MCCRRGTREVARLLVGSKKKKTTRKLNDKTSLSRWNITLCIIILYYKVYFLSRVNLHGYQSVLVTRVHVSLAARGVTVRSFLRLGLMAYINIIYTRQKHKYCYKSFGNYNMIFYQRTRSWSNRTHEDRRGHTHPFLTLWLYYRWDFRHFLRSFKFHVKLQLFGGRLCQMFFDLMHIIYVEADI